MSVFAMESQYMKTIMIHLADKSDFILSITKHVANLCSKSSGAFKV